jgi:hypothetical protein
MLAERGFDAGDFLAEVADTSAQFLIHVWRLVNKWARHTHPNKPNGWVTSRYFGRFNESRQDRWVFGDRESGRYLTKFAWTRIVRHQLVIKGASVDDPALTEYWALRRRRNKPPLSPLLLRLLQRQHGRCPLCGSLLLHADRQSQSPHEWEQWMRAIRTAVRANALTTAPNGSQSDDPVASRLTPVHGDQPLWLPVGLQGLLEPDAVNAARPVLRGVWRSNAPHLPDNTRSPTWRCATPCCRVVSYVRPTRPACSRRCGPC